MSFSIAIKTSAGRVGRYATVYPCSAVLALMLLTGTWLRAQSYSVDGFVITGGGGSGVGGDFAVSGTIGQAGVNAQPLTGGSFSLQGGFWTLFVVPTPGAPLLRVSHSLQASAATVSWPSSSPGFILQHAAELNGTNWSLVPQAVNDDGTNKFVVINGPAGIRFYRLIKP